MHHEMNKLPFTPRFCFPQIYAVMKVAFVFMQSCPQKAILWMVFCW